MSKATRYAALARIVKEPGLRDVDRKLFTTLIERGAWREPVQSSARELANTLSYSTSTIYASLRRLAQHQLISQRRDGRRASAYQALM